MNRLMNVFAWEVTGQWYYTASPERAPPIAVVVHCYETDGRTVLYWPNADSGVLIWDAQCDD